MHLCRLCSKSKCLWPLLVGLKGLLTRTVSARLYCQKSPADLEWPGSMPLLDNSNSAARRVAFRTESCPQVEAPAESATGANPLVVAVPVVMNFKSKWDLHIYFSAKGGALGEHSFNSSPSCCGPCFSAINSSISSWKLRSNRALEPDRSSLENRSNAAWSWNSQTLGSTTGWKRAGHRFGAFQDFARGSSREHRAQG